MLLGDGYARRCAADKCRIFRSNIWQGGKWKKRKGSEKTRVGVRGSNIRKNKKGETREKLREQKRRVTKIGRPRKKKEKHEKKKRIEQQKNESDETADMNQTNPSWTQSAEY